MTYRHPGSNHEPDHEPEPGREPEPQASDASPGDAELTHELRADSGRKRTPKRRRGRWIAVATVVAAITVMLIGIGMRGSGTGGGEPPKASPTPSASKPEGQRTLLIQVRNDNDLGSNNLISGVNGGLPPAQVLVPSRTIVDVPSAGQQTLGQSARLLNRSASQDALSNLLALRIDGTLSLGRLALAGMVDFVGGITLNVSEAISEQRPDNGQARVVVPKGTVQLNGSQAATYALTWLPDEPESARLRRYSEVMTATIRGLPADQLVVEGMLTSLGGQARTTTTTSDVAAYLVSLRSQLRRGGQQVRVLPTSEPAAGGLAPARVDLNEADAVLGEVLPQAMLDDETARPRVLVQNGVGAPGMGTRARDKLTSAGMVYINDGNAEELGQEKTRIILPNESVTSRETGAAIAQALGVGQSSIKVDTSKRDAAAAVVILGQDFQPSIP